MNKKVVVIIVVILLLMSIVLIFIAYKPPKYALLSADKVKIEELTGAGFGSDGELKNAYWVVTLTVDVKQSHFFLLDTDLTSIIDKSGATFQGKTVRPYSTINITIIPEEPYYACMLEKMSPFVIVPDGYDVYRGTTNETFRHDALTNDGLYQCLNPQWDLYTPFTIIVEKNGVEVNRIRIVAIGSVEKQWFVVGDETSSDKARVDVVAKLTTGYSPPPTEKFVIFNTPDKALSYNVYCQDGYVRYIPGMIRFKSKTISTTWFPNVEVPDYDNMEKDYSYFRYWVGGDASATSGVYDSAYMKYHWYQSSVGQLGGLPSGNPAIGKNRPNLYYSSDYGIVWVDYGYCVNYPAWTPTDKTYIWGLGDLYQSALYSRPSLLEDNSGTTPVGMSVWSWLISKGANVLDVGGLHDTRIERKDNELDVYYPTGSCYDLITLRISTELTDTYVYGEYFTKFDILDDKSYWQSTGSLTDVNLIQKVPETLIITVKNIGNISANAQLKIVPVYPSNFFSIVSMPQSIISTNPIEVGNVYTFNIVVEQTGSSLGFDFKLEVSVWCDADKQDSIFVEGKVLESQASLKIYTVGDNNKAKIYINGVETPRNKVTYYEAVLPKGTYKIEFQTLENLNVPIITVNNVQTGYGWALIALNPGDSKVIVATYVASNVSLTTCFVSWNDKGLFGLSPTYNPLVGSRVFVPEWNVVKLKINVTAIGTVQGNLTIVILADENVPVYYTEKCYEISLGSGATKILDIDFMLGGAKGYYYQVVFDNAVIYADTNVDTRPEVFTIPWYMAYGLYIGISVLVVIAIAIVLYYVKLRAIASGGIRY